MSGLFGGYFKFEPDCTDREQWTAATLWLVHYTSNSEPVQQQSRGLWWIESATKLPESRAFCYGPRDRFSAMSSIFAAMMKSFSWSPRIFLVCRDTVA